MVEGAPELQTPSPSVPAVATSAEDQTTRILARAEPNGRAGTGAYTLSSLRDRGRVANEYEFNQRRGLHRGVGGLAGRIIAFREQTAADITSFEQARSTAAAREAGKRSRDVLDALSSQLNEATRTEHQQDKQQPPSRDKSSKEATIATVAVDDTSTRPRKSAGVLKTLAV